MNVVEYKEITEKIIDQRDLLYQTVKRYEKEIEALNKKIDLYEDFSEADSLVIDYFEEKSNKYEKQMFDSMSEVQIDDYNNNKHIFDGSHDLEIRTKGTHVLDPVLLIKFKETLTSKDRKIFNTFWNHPGLSQNNMAKKAGIASSTFKIKRDKILNRYKEFLEANKTYLIIKSGKI